jgi:hypothetical protein
MENAQLDTVSHVKVHVFHSHLDLIGPAGERHGRY